MAPKTTEQLAAPVKHMSIQHSPAAHIVTNQIHNKAGIIFTFDLLFMYYRNRTQWYTHTHTNET